VAESFVSSAPLKWDRTSGAVAGLVALGHLCESIYGADSRVTQSVNI
jgi:hypothetical protein